MKLCLSTLLSAILGIMLTAEGGLNHNAVIYSGFEASCTTIGGGGLVLLQPDSVTGSKQAPRNDIWLWADPYLTWELLYSESGARYRLYNAHPDSDHICLIYGPNASDFESDSLRPRYDPYVQHEISDITDYSYQPTNLFAILRYLGGDPAGGIDSMTTDDNLFLYVVSHGSGSFFYVANSSSKIYYSTLDDSLRQISSNSQVIWLQPCGSGGGIPYLVDTDRVILTSSKVGEYDFVCDDIVQWDTVSMDPGSWEQEVVKGSENEPYVVSGDTIYQDHSGFSFHAINAASGETPTGQTRVADTDGNLLVSMKEAYDHVIEWDSWQYHGWSWYPPRNPQYSDSGNLGDSLFFGWDDGSVPDTVRGLAPSGSTKVIGWPRLDWSKNTEQDLVGYTVYRDANRIASTADTLYKDFTVVDTTYRYFIRAFDLMSNEGATSDTSIITVAFTDICGDVNSDSVVTIADATYITSYLYRGGPPPGCPPWPYLSCADVNLDSAVTIADATYLVAYIYRGGPPPCQPGKGPASGDYATVGLSEPRSSGGVLEVEILAEFDVQVWGVHLQICYDPESIEMLHPLPTSRSKPLEVLYDLTLEPGCLTLGMIDHRGQRCITPGRGSILTLRLRGRHGMPDIKSLRLKEAMFVDTYSGELRVTVLNEVTPFPQEQSVPIAIYPAAFELLPSYPNPFKSEATICYAIPRRARVTVDIYDACGRLVRTLVDGTLEPGYYRVRLQSKPVQEDALPSGVYFVKMESEGFKSTRKVVMLR